MDGRQLLLVGAMRTARAAFAASVVAHARQYVSINPIKEEEKSAVKSKAKARDWDDLGDDEEDEDDRPKGKVTIRHQLNAEEVATLRSDRTFVVAEILYLLKATVADSPDELRTLLQTHSDSIRAAKRKLDKSSDVTTDSGLTPTRLKRGIFTPLQIESAVSELEGTGKLTIDQRVFAGLLIETMSAETNRQVLLTLADCGFIKRIGKTTVRIGSQGILEDLYGLHLAAILPAVRVEEFA